MSNGINIEVVSDFACPWCFIGHRRVKEAIALRPDLEFALVWRPFQLNPDMPFAGQNRREYYRNKFGDERAASLRETLQNVGAQEGIVFCNEPDAMAPNTLRAHVLMYWASENKNVDTDALAEKLFHVHHVACENIGDQDVLVRIAGQVGMDEIAVRSKLAAGQDEDKLKAQVRQSAADGVSSVPFYLINQKYSISGAQPAENLASAFDQIVNAAP
jgi:predicted DsbA family dithiol-disulfide isomerase